MSTGKGKAPTLRQQMRDQAEVQLDEILVEASKALLKVTQPLKLNHVEVSRMIGCSQTDTLRKKLVTELANKNEAELVKLWNNQKLLDLGDEGED